MRRPEIAYNENNNTELSSEKQAPTKTSTDVLIVGSGPVGLLLAPELSRDAVDVLLIDHHKTRSFFCKALASPRARWRSSMISASRRTPSIAFWLRGVSAFNYGLPGPSMEVPTDLPFAVCRWRSSTPSGFWKLVCTVVAEGCCMAVRSAALRRGPMVSAPKSRDQTGEQQTVDCRWLVGCDGAHSKVRSTLGLDFVAANIRRLLFSRIWRWAGICRALDVPI